MAENADLAVARDPVREYQDLMAAVGRMVVGAAAVEYCVAVLVAVPRATGTRPPGTARCRWSRRTARQCASCASSPQDRPSAAT
jgi:hypothetical protein